MINVFHRAALDLLGRTQYSHPAVLAAVQQLTTTDRKQQL